MSKVLVCDPPRGWMYDFPRALPSEHLSETFSLRDWLLKNGYPEKDVDFAVRHCRYWEV